VDPVVGVGPKRGKNHSKYLFLKVLPDLEKVKTGKIAKFIRLGI